MKAKRCGLLWDVFELGTPTKEVPNTCGVYLIVIKDNKTGRKKIEYAGTTKCFRYRYSSHELKQYYRRFLTANETAFFYFHQIDNGRNQLECRILRRYNPKMNRNGTNAREKSILRIRNYNKIFGKFVFGN